MESLCLVSPEQHKQEGSALGAQRRKRTGEGGVDREYYTEKVREKNTAWRGTWGEQRPEMQSLGDLDKLDGTVG